MNCVLFAKMDQVFSKENKTLKKYWKIGKNTGKVREKSGNFVSPEKWEPWSGQGGVQVYTQGGGVWGSGQGGVQAHTQGGRFGGLAKGGLQAQARGCVFQHALRQTPQQTATAANGKRGGGAPPTAQNFLDFMLFCF